MHPEIREIIDHSHYCRATVLEVEKLLPEDDAELGRWIIEAITQHEQIEFLYLAVAVQHTGRPFHTRYLARGLQLMHDHYFACCIACHMDGDDMPE